MDRRALILLAILLALASFTTRSEQPGGGDTREGGDRPPPTMRNPGPDLGGDYPNSGSVVPPGRLYLEAGVFSGYTIAFGYHRSLHLDAFEIPVLVRYGVAPKLELRVTAGLFTVLDEPDGDLRGAGPVQVGCKYNLVDPSRAPHGTAVAFEFEAVLPLASADLDSGKVEPALQLNFDHPLPSGFSINWNAGVSSGVDPDDDLFAQANLQWSVDKDVGEDFSVFVTGFFIHPHVKPQGGTEIVAGLGFLWYPNDRTSLQVTLATGLEEQQETAVQVSAGFAF